MPEPPPSPPLANETVFQYLVRFVALLKDREEQLGGHSGDGLTAAQADDLLEKIRQVAEPPNGDVPVSDMWEAFRATVDAETSWLFEERDPIGKSIAWALRRLQETFGKFLEDYGPVSHEDLDKYVSLSLVRQAASRQVALGNGGFSIRLALARLFHWLGGGVRQKP